MICLSEMFRLSLCLSGKDVSEMRYMHDATDQDPKSETVTTKKTDKALLICRYLCTDLRLIE